MTTELHPFLAAVQAAHREHGLPPGIARVSVGHTFAGDPDAYSVHLEPEGKGFLTACLGWSREGFSAAVADAHANLAKVRGPDAARELLQKHGFDPSLVKDA